MMNCFPSGPTTYFDYSVTIDELNFPTSINETMANHMDITD